jgi:signal transduction histidine kinase
VNYESELSPPLVGEAADASMIDRTRLVLSISALLTVFVDPAIVDGVTGITWIVFFGYALHSLVLYILSQLDQRFLRSTLVHWLDVGWYALIVFFTGGGNSFFFVFFFFVILASSFRWGFQEGARVTLASSALFTLTGLVSVTEVEISRLLLRTTFVLALGYMIAYWGGSEVAQKRRLALLRDISRLSNPRFGVDHTIASVLEKTRTFFTASSCILVKRDSESATWSLRTAMEDNAERSIKAERISAEAAAPLMAFPQEQIVIYNRGPWPAFAGLGECLMYDQKQPRWMRRIDESGDSLAELLEARSFITVPLSLRKGEGRIYVMSSKHGFSKGDALFLSHIVAQTSSVIENIDLLDRLASDAALRERQKIARDLHDTTIQPYIGLKHGLCAIRNKAALDNPLIEDLDKLTAMVTQVIGDLRHYAGTFKSGSELSDPVFLVALRRQAAQVREFYGIDITVGMDGEFDLGDRLAAEVFQILNEGMSNIRKHTMAQHGCITLKCTNGWITIRIENECPAGQVVEFTPRSIAERAGALGGRARVERAKSGMTVVHVEIPV